MAVLGYLPLIIALCLGIGIVLSFFNPVVDRLVTRLSLSLFREFVENHGWNRHRREQLLRGIHSTTTYPVYASRTILMSLIGGGVGFVVSLYGGVAFIFFLIANKDVFKASFPEQFHFVVVTDADQPGPAAGAGQTGALEIPLGSFFEFIVPDSLEWVIEGIFAILPQELVPSFPDTITIATPNSRPLSEVEVLVRLPTFDFLPESITALTVYQLVLLAAGGAVIGLVSAVGVYLFRWHLVKDEARSRRLRINRDLPPTAAFIFASSRSGMTYPEIMRTIATNPNMFGETAKEIGVVVKEMDLFGVDLIRALQGIAQQSPSEKFGEFADSLASALQSGQNVSEFLRTKHEQFKAEQEANQKQILDILAALGEGYVALLVAGPLFLLTILIIFGLLTGGLLEIIQLIVYLLIPLANIGFMIYLNEITKPLMSTRIPTDEKVPRQPLAVRRADDAIAANLATDGGADTDVGHVNLRRLEMHKRVKRAWGILTNPVDTVLKNPISLLYVTIPLGVGSIILRWWLAGDVGIETIDNFVIQAILFVVGSFALVYEFRSRQLKTIEAVIPSFLDNLASTNAAGKTFTGSLKRVDRSGLGPLNTELERLLVDIEWGGRTEHALDRFSNRVGSATVARIVALIRNAMRASGNIGFVIRIAAAEARKDLHLNRSRRQEMFVYVIVVYISFAVFLGIATVIQTILVPAVPSADQFGAGVTSSPFGPQIALSTIDEAMKAKFTLVLYHASGIQAIFAGFVAGQMGEGRIAAGAKHVTIMLAVAYGVFFLIV